jgi:hypothetical protein
MLLLNNVVANQNLLLLHGVVRNQSLLGAFIVKEAKDCMYMHKIMHPRDFEK